MKKLLLYLSVLLTVLLGCQFIFSAYTKLFPVELLEYTMVDTKIIGWNLAPFLSRALIGAEFFIGISLLLFFRLKKFTLPIVFSLLCFFSVYLIFILLKTGNNGDCGCYGTALHVTPLVGLIRNVLLNAVVFFIRTHPFDFSFRFKKWLMIVSAVVSISLPFILNPITDDANLKEMSSGKPYTLPLEILYNSTTNKHPEIDLTKGKHLICFFSLTCSHCRLAAHKLHSINLRNISIPVFMILNGDEKMLAEFFEETKTENIPHILFKGPKEYLQLAGPELPAILWVNNSIVEKKFNIYSLEQSELEKLMLN